MGWTIGYQVIRDRRLDPVEIDKLAALVRELNETPWDADAFRLGIADEPIDGIVATGDTSISTGDESDDGARICDALTALQALLPDAEVRAVDDFDLLGWDPLQRRFDFCAGERRRLLDSNGGSWRSVLELVPPGPPSYPPELAAALSSLASGDLPDATRRDATVIGQALAALSRLERNTAPIERLVALIAACDASTVARTGLACYPDVQHHLDVRHALAHAFEAVSGGAALAPLFLAAWREPRGTYYYGDFWLPDALARSIASQSPVRDELICDVDIVESEHATSDLDRRRAERAVQLLAASGDRVAIARLLKTVRRWRSVKAPHAIYHHVLLPALEALGRHPDPSAVPAMLLALDGSVMRTRAEHCALAGAARARPELALPVIRELLEQSIGVAGALEAVEALGAPGAKLAALVEMYLRYPLLHVRRLAARVLEPLRGVAPVIDEAIDPEAFLIHRNDEVRHETLRALHDRRDRSLFRSLVVAEAIDHGLRKLTEDNCPPFSWSSWQDLLPDTVVRSSIADRLAWARDHAEAVLGPQRVLGPLAQILEIPTAEVVAWYAPARLELDDALREMLAALER